MNVPQKWKFGLLCDPATAFLSVYPKNPISCYRNVCISMFITAFFYTVNKWYQTICHSAHEWIMKVRPIHTTEIYVSIEKNGIMIIAGN